MHGAWPRYLNSGSSTASRQKAATSARAIEPACERVQVVVGGRSGFWRESGVRCVRRSDVEGGRGSRVG
jgi:hypothetical protein